MRPSEKSCLRKGQWSRLSRVGGLGEWGVVVALSAVTAALHKLK